MHGPCQWPLETSPCTKEQTTALDNIPDHARALVEAFAVELLWAWTGRQFGVCEVTVRPCLAGGCGPTGQGSVWGGDLGGPVGCGHCAQVGCCRPGHGLGLPGPVTEITQVLLDGVLFDDWVWDGRGLARTDRRDWPECQDTTLPPTHVGTFQVTYRRGVPVPAGGRIAAGVLVAELARAWCGDNGCQLPRRLQTVVRQGVTVGVALDDFKDLELGKTGIWLIDSFVSSTRAPTVGATIVSVDTLPAPGRPLARSLPGWGGRGGYRPWGR